MTLNVAMRRQTWQVMMIIDNDDKRRHYYRRVQPFRHSQKMWRTDRRTDFL